MAVHVDGRLAFRFGAVKELGSSVCLPEETGPDSILQLVTQSVWEKRF